MKRDLQRMASEPFDVIVIGGGITGACTAWDATLRGMKTALLEKVDFSSGTSSATSKLLHGGLRYLKNAQFGVVRDSLRERRIMSKIAPHLVRPQAFMVPLYGWGLQGVVGMSAAMVLYHLLGLDRNKELPPELRLPWFHFLSRAETLAAEPLAPQDGLLGSFVYYDCQMLSPERHALEFVLSAYQKGCQVANHAAVKRLVMVGNRVIGVEVQDQLSGTCYELRGSVVVNAAGPWSDQIDAMLGQHPHGEVVRSMGIHFVTRALSQKHALVMQTPHGRHFFVIPWRGKGLIGTTDALYKGTPSAFCVTEAHIADFLEEINATLPNLNLTRADIQSYYGGLRPLVGNDSEKNVYKASRKYEIFDHEKEAGVQGMLSALGGKYTTSRHLAESLVDSVASKLKRSCPPCRTAETPLQGHPGGRLEDFCEVLCGRYPDYQPDRIRHFVHCYGAATEPLLAYAAEKGLGLDPLAPNTAHALVEVDWAVQREMAMRLTDVVFRRTGMATAGLPDQATLEALADRMGSWLHWTADRKAAEVALAQRHHRRGYEDHQLAAGEMPLQHRP